MKRMVRLIGAGVITMTVASIAAAQEPAGLLQGIGAVTNAADSHPSYGGAIGGRIAGWVEMTGEFGRMQDVTPKDLRDLLRAVPGVPNGAVFVRVPAYYGLLNVKLVPSHGVLRPFVTGGAGLARLDPQFTFGSAVVTLPSVFTPERSTRPMATVGAGLRLGLGPHLTVDGGYRYSRIFSDYNVDRNLRNDRILTNVGAFYAAIGVRF